jgi:pimeloyl-ACP methyl ester carboxylesterase
MKINYFIKNSKNFLLNHGVILIGFFVVVGLILFPFSADFRNINVTNASTQLFEQTLTSDTEWTLAGSPYIITDFLNISPNVTLTIDPGVVVKFEQGSIDVSGTLIAKGDADNPVIFTSLFDDSAGGKAVSWSTGNPAPGDWGSIDNRGGIISLDNTRVSYGGSVCVSLVRAPIKLQIAQASFCYDSNVIYGYGSTSIDNSEISNNKAGLESDDGNLIINNSKIFSNGGSALFNYGDNQVNAINNWWGDDSGPYESTSNPQGKGDEVYGNVLFDPWVGKTVGHIPVIIVPGIVASYLNNSSTGEEIWPNITKMEGPFDTYLDVLQIDKNQNQINNSIKPTDVFRGLAGNDFLSGLIRELENNGYQENKDLFVFPYDWRLNLDYTAGDSPYSWQKTLKQEIAEVEATTSSGKVDIIAHSMGGLLAKDYIDKYGDGDIDKLIDVATPNLGAPLAFKILNYGDNLNFCQKILGVNVCILNSGEVEKISQNMPSIYQLLPSRGYFTSSFPGATNGYIYNYDLSIKGISQRFLTYDESLNYLKNAGRNDFLLGLSGDNNSINVNDELHSHIDDLPSNPNYYNIVGCGQATYAGIKTIWNTKFEDITPVQGDGTVPLSSADDFGNNKYYVASSSHAFLPSINGVRQLIVSILQNNENNFDFSNYKYLSKDVSVCPGVSGTQVGSHSPVELNIYDESGNHTGPTADGDIEENIPGVIYDVLGEDKYAWLPTGHSYRIVNNATSSGELGITIEKIANDQETQFVYYNGIKLSSASTSVSYDISDNQTSYQATVDPDGSGQKDQVIAPSSILTGDQINDITAPSSTISISGQMGNNGYYISNVVVGLSAQDNVGGSGVLKTEYSLDNGQTWSDYQGSFTISQTGTTTIDYYSIDKAGNQEAQQVKIIKIDKAAPVISILLPQENQEIGHDQTLTTTYFASDDFSGVATNTAKIYFDNQIITSSTIDLFRQTLGSHKIKISIQDLAGNLASSTVDFSVITDIDGTISDVNRAYSEKMISKDQARKDLVNDLTDIQTFQAKYGSKIAKEQDLKAKAMTLCLKHKSQNWCIARIGTIFDRFEYQMSKVNQLLINLKYQTILVTLDLDLKLKVINSTGYDIIKADVKYLISNL